MAWTFTLSEKDVSVALARLGEPGDEDLHAALASAWRHSEGRSCTVEVPTEDLARFHSVLGLKFNRDDWDPRTNYGTW